MPPTRPSLQAPTTTNSSTTTTSPPYTQHHVASPPLSTAAAAAQPPSKPKPTAPPPPRRRSVLHPSIAVLLGVNTHWHIPLLVCRGLSTLPAAWWGLRCLLTFVGEVMVEGADEGGGWSVERRFRVTEVFLALLWVS